MVDLEAVPSVCGATIELYTITSDTLSETTRGSSLLMASLTFKCRATVAAATVTDAAARPTLTKRLADRAPALWVVPCVSND